MAWELLHGCRYSLKGGLRLLVLKDLCYSLINRLGPLICEYRLSLFNAMPVVSAHCMNTFFQAHYDALVSDDFAPGNWIFSTIFTSSARDCACIFCIARLR